MRRPGFVEVLLSAATDVPNSEKARMRSLNPKDLNFTAIGERSYAF